MPLCAMRIDRIDPSPAARVRAGRAIEISQASTNRRFLLSEPGFYCETCLARAVGLSPSEVRRGVREVQAGAFTIRYRVCNGCGVEREVIAINA